MNDIKTLLEEVNNSPFPIPKDAGFQFMTTLIDAQAHLAKAMEKEVDGILKTTDQILND